MGFTPSRSLDRGVIGRMSYDKKDQWDKVESGLTQGENLLAVFDCTGVGTGFVGVTSKRVVLQDNSFIGKQSAVTSIPYRQIQAVSFVSDKSVLGKFASSSTIALTVGSSVREATFRGEDKAKYIHDTILWHVFQVN